jgi:hypothetical protein
MEIISIDNINYILCDYILLNAPVYSKGCCSSRDLIKKKKIEPSKFIYAKKFNDKWIKTKGKSVKFDKVIIKEDIIKDIPELIILCNSIQIINDNSIEQVPDIIRSTNDGIEQVPNIIHSTDDENVKDKNNIKVKNVANAFTINDLLMYYVLNK